MKNNTAPALDVARKIPFVTSSLMGTFINCPYAFLEFFNSGGYETYRMDTGDEPIYLEFGTLIHGVIEAFWKTNERKTRRFLIDTYEADIVKTGFTDKSYITLGYEMLNNFFNYLLFEAPKRKSLHSELSFKLKVGGVPLHGTIDQVYYLGDGIYEIEDYKTSKHLLTKDELEENIQLSVYDIAFSSDQMSQYWYRGIKPVGIILTINNLRHNVRLQTERTPYSRTNALNYFRLIYKQMQFLDDSKLKPKLNAFCCYCDCCDKCEAYASVVDDSFESDIDTETIKGQLALLQELDARIKILTNEKAICQSSVYEYLSNYDCVEYDGNIYSLTQQGRRYVKTKEMIKILQDNNLFDMNKYVSIPVGEVDAILKANPDLEYKIKSAIGYSYTNPSITSKVAPKLFKHSKTKTRS